MSDSDTLRAELHHIRKQQRLDFTYLQLQHAETVKALQLQHEKTAKALDAYAASTDAVLDRLERAVFDDTEPRLTSLEKRVEALEARP